MVTHCSMKSLAQFKLKQFCAAKRGNTVALAAELQVTPQAISQWVAGTKVPGPNLQGQLWELGHCQPNEWHMPWPNAADNGDMERAA